MIEKLFLRKQNLAETTEKSKNSLKFARKFFFSKFYSMKLYNIASMTIICFACLHEDTKICLFLLGKFLFSDGAYLSESSVNSLLKIAKLICLNLHMTWDYKNVIYIFFIWETNTVSDFTLQRTKIEQILSFLFKNT